MLGDAAAEASAVAADVRSGHEPGDVVLSLRNLALAPKLEDVSLELRRGEVLGIAGLQGAGRTELVRCIAGFEQAERGEIAIDGEPIARPTPARMLALGVGMTPENRKADGIVPELGVDENIVLARFPRAGRGPLISLDAVRRAAEELRARLDIKTARIDLPIGSLSGGNQQKAVIGRWLHAGSRILLLDEPTRGVDVESKAQIYRLARDLAAEGAAIVFVSSELEELPLVCDRVLVLRGGRVAAEHRAPDLSLDAIVADTITEHT
nr:ATP-binding cassette domain-containing protein [Conexibacter arvalis]